MSKPIAVLISDIHYNLQTLEVADKALRMAVEKASALDVPLVIAGDLHDTKANLRGECVTAIRNTLKTADRPPFVIVGNHDRINERTPAHSLTFLEDLATLVDGYSGPFPSIGGTYLIPYHDAADELRAYLKTLPQGSRLIMHQGLQGSATGEYIADKSALQHGDVADFRVISGHYHYRQDVKVGRSRKGAVGLFSYIGNPYTLGYGEAGHPEKGFQILHDNGLLVFVPTNLRKHVVIEVDLATDGGLYTNNALLTSGDDVVWVKVRGASDQLQNLSKEEVGRAMLLSNFRLDLIPDATETAHVDIKSSTQPELYDGLIDSLTNTSEDRKDRLKTMWKEFA